MPSRMSYLHLDSQCQQKNISQFSGYLVRDNLCHITSVAKSCQVAITSPQHMESVLQFQSHIRSTSPTIDSLSAESTKSKYHKTVSPNHTIHAFLITTIDKSKNPKMISHVKTKKSQMNAILRWKMVVPLTWCKTKTCHII